MFHIKIPEAAFSIIKHIFDHILKPKVHLACILLALWPSQEKLCHTVVPGTVLGHNIPHLGHSIGRSNSSRANYTMRMFPLSPEKAAMLLTQ